MDHCQSTCIRHAKCVRDRLFVDIEWLKDIQDSVTSVKSLQWIWEDI